MSVLVRLITCLTFTALAAACAPAQPSVLQKTDPIKDEIVTLQKQLLELQVLQNETKKQLDASRALITELSSRLRSVEANAAAAAEQRAELSSRAAATSAEHARDGASHKKKTLRKTKKKKTRRQG